MNERIEKIITEVFKTKDFEIIKRLIGGRSNYTYVIAVNGCKYTLRIIGKNGNFFINRQEELLNLEKIAELGLNNRTYYFDPESGVKISEYIEGISLDQLNVSDYLSGVANTLRILHKTTPFHADYAPLDRLFRYENLCFDLGYSHEPLYYELKKAVVSKIAKLKTLPLVACHNDSQPSNFIVSEDKIYLTDWEFSGNNDFHYDIAAFAESNIENAYTLLDVYLQRKATNEEKKRVTIWRAFQTLQWHNVAVYKEMIGLSQELKVDFAAVAKNYLQMTKDLLAKSDNL